MLSWRSIRRCVTALIAVALVLSGLLLAAQVRRPRIRSPATTGVRPRWTGHARRRRMHRLAPDPKGPKPVVTHQGDGGPEAPVGAAARTSSPSCPRPAPRRTGWSASPGVPSTTERTSASRSARSVKGAWTPWQTLENDDDSPGDAGRPGTEPIWVGRARGRRRSSLVGVRHATRRHQGPDDRSRRRQRSDRDDRDPGCLHDRVA